MVLVVLFIVVVIVGRVYARRVCDAYVRAGEGLSGRSRFGVVVRAVLVLLAFMVVGAVAGMLLAAV